MGRLPSYDPYHRTQGSTNNHHPSCFTPGWGPAEWEVALGPKVRVQRLRPPSSSSSAAATPEEVKDEDGGEEAEWVPALLARWLPWGYDLYVIGVQESACLREMRRSVHEYLGGWMCGWEYWMVDGNIGCWIWGRVSFSVVYFGGLKDSPPSLHQQPTIVLITPSTGGPEAYTFFGREIGDARVLHGLIAVTIFVRTRHVREGVFQVQQGAVNRVATGVNLGPMGRAANKGG